MEGGEGGGGRDSIRWTGRCERHGRVATEQQGALPANGHTAAVAAAAIYPLRPACPPRACRLEAAFDAEVKRLGGVHSARPKQILDALRPQFPELDLQLQSCKWHLQTLRKRELREQQWLATPSGPVRWTGKLREAFNDAVAELGGVHAARPKAVWERLQPTYPVLTIQSIKWHLQTLRKKVSQGEDEDETMANVDRSRGSSPADDLASAGQRRMSEQGTPSAKRPQSEERQTQSQQSARQRRQQQRQQQEHVGGSDTQAERKQSPPLLGLQQLPGRCSRSASQLDLRDLHGMPAAVALQQRWLPPPPGVDLLPEAEAMLVEAQTSTRRLRQMIAALERHAMGQAEVVRLLEVEQACGGEATHATLTALLERLRATQQAGGDLGDPFAAAVLAAASSLHARTPAATGAAASSDGLVPTRRRRDTAVLGSLVPLVQQAAAPATDGQHDPQTCVVPRCRRCAYLRRRAGQAGGAAAHRRASPAAHPPAQAAPTAASGGAAGTAVAQRVQQQLSVGGLADVLQLLSSGSSLGPSSGSGSAGSLPGGLSAMLAMPPRQPSDAALAALALSDPASTSSLGSLLYTAQQMELAGSGGAGDLLELLHTDPALLGSAAAALAVAASGGAAAEQLPASPTAALSTPPGLAAHPASAVGPAEQLSATFPALDAPLCVAICHTVPASAAGQRAMAHWLLQAGATTAGDAVRLLGSSPHALQTASEACLQHGVRPLEWATLVHTCKHVAAL